MFAIDHNTVLGPRKLTSRPNTLPIRTIGLRPGTYGNDHTIVAMTPGMPQAGSRESPKLLSGKACA